MEVRAVEVCEGGVMSPLFAPTSERVVELDQRWLLSKEEPEEESTSSCPKSMSDSVGGDAGSLPLPFEMVLEDSRSRPEPVRLKEEELPDLLALKEAIVFLEDTRRRVF